MGRGKSSSPQTMTTTPIELNNQFNNLNPDDDMSDDGSTNTKISIKRRRTEISNSQHPVKMQASKSAPKPPPINIQGISRANAHHLLTSVRKKQDDYVLKLTNYGVRVFASDSLAYSALKEKLKSVGNKFFTYQPREEKLTKIVLHGLYEMPENELMGYLGDLGIKPVSIKKLTIHQKKYSDHCVYLLQFSKSQNVKISHLREIKAINYVAGLKWEFYKNKRQGPIQCANCMQYGHGSNCCFLDPMCIRCAGNHKSSECSLLKDPTTNEIRQNIENEKLKCGLCGQNHTANFSGCTKRKEFIERQQFYRSRNQRRNRPPSGPAKFVPAQQLQNFPQSLDPQASINAQAWQSSPQSSGFNELFSGQELFSIFGELMSSLKGAKTKEEQIYALGGIVIKYCHNGSSK